MTTVRRGGLLTEGTRTNLLLRSEEFEDAAWLKTALGGTAITTVVTANAGRSPRGDMTADRVVIDKGAGTTTTDRARISQAFTGVSGTTYTISFWLWAADPADIGKTFRASGTGFGISQNAIVPATPTRFVFSGAATTTSLTFLIELRGDPTTPTSDKVDVFIWGAQIEAGSFATSYIPTVAATVTRPTDQVSYADFPQPAEIAARGGITVYHRFVEQGTRSTNGAFAFRVGSGAPANTLALFDVQQSGGDYFVVFRNRLNAAVSTSLGLPAFGALVEVVARLEHRVEGGENQFRVSSQRAFDGVVTTQTPSGWISAEGAITNGWETAPNLFVGARDGGNAAGFALNQALKARFGIHDLASMRALV